LLVSRGFASSENRINGESRIGAFSFEPMVTMIGMFFAALLFVAIAAVSGGFFNAFTISVWMYCYAKMHRKGVPSRISHYLSAF
jgi:hypothetical protein